MKILKQGSVGGNVISALEENERRIKDFIINNEIICKSTYGCGSVFQFEKEDNPRVISKKDESGCLFLNYILCPVCSQRIYLDK